jgi:glycosyltransferase involved in cell wall biosynthesis
MRILVLSYEYPPIGGGGGIICRNVTERMAGMGHQMTVVTAALSTSDVAVSNTKSENLKIVRLRTFRKRSHQSNPVEMLAWINVTKEYLRRFPVSESFDLCMAHFVLPGGEVAMWLKKHFGIRYCLVSHGHDIPWVHPRQMFLFHLGSYLRIKAICRGSSAIFVQTQKMKDNFLRFAGERESGKCHIVPNGTDYKIFHPNRRSENGKLKILFVGRLVIQKDPMTLLKSVRLVAEQIGDFTVRIIGDGSLKKKLERFADKNELSQYVEFSGKIGIEEMAGEYHSAHILIAPSLNEGMSLSAIEALRSGVYLIATRASGFEDLIVEGRNGEFLKFGDFRGLAGKICDFNTRRTIGLLPDLGNIDLLPTRLDWANLTGDYLKIIGAILTQKMGV